MNSELLKSLSAHLTESLQQEVQLLASTPVSGGDINAAYQLESSQGPFFAKLNAASKFPGMFEAEAKGLECLRSAGVINIPKVITHGETGDHCWLLLEWVSNAGEALENGRIFGGQLAQLHQKTNASFGLDHNNYIGSLSQNNRQHSDWTSFLVEERLEAQLRLAYNAKTIDPATSAAFSRLFDRLDQLFPSEPPALLHGDLWGGNYLTDNNGKAWLIDPAVYYGHREMELGMTQLFGGFGNEFYQGYEAIYPLEPDWKSRIGIAQLYPLLVHVNLFGGSYLSQVQSILRRFT